MRATIFTARGAAGEARPYRLDKHRRQWLRGYFCTTS